MSSNAAWAHNKTVSKRAGEMAEWLKTLAALQRPWLDSHHAGAAHSQPSAAPVPGIGPS